MNIVFSAVRRLNAWMSRHLPWIALAGFLVACFILGMINYYGDRVEQTIAVSPPLSKKQARVLKDSVVSLQGKARKASAGKVRAVRRADSIQVYADYSQFQVDSLTHRYEQVPAAAARATDEQLFRHLAGYRPSPFPDTSARE